MTVRKKNSPDSADGELKRLRKQVRDLEAALAASRNTIEALREGEEQLRVIVEHSTNLFYLHTPDHVLKYVSPQSRKFFDCEPKEALVRWTEFLTDDPGNARGVLATQAAIDTGMAQPPYELELRGPKGRTIRVEVHEAPVVKNGKTLAIVGALTDITERKRAEEELSRNKEWLQLLIDRMPMGCIVWDTEFRVSLWNPRPRGSSDTGTGGAGQASLPAHRAAGGPSADRRGLEAPALRRPDGPQPEREHHQGRPLHYLRLVQYAFQGK